MQYFMLLSLRLSLEKLRPLERKLWEKESQIAELESQVLVYYDRAVSDFKASQEFKDLLQAARDGAITEKFNEQSEHKYLDHPHMVVNLLAAKAQAHKDAQPVLTEGPPETQAKTVRDDDNDYESEGEEELVDSAKKDQVQEFFFFFFFYFAGLCTFFIPHFEQCPGADP